MKLLSTLLLAAFLFAMTSIALAEFTDFETDPDPGVWTTLGTAYVNNGTLVLTDDIGSQAGAIYLNEQYNPIDQMQASFDLMISSPAVDADGAVFCISSSIEIGGNGSQMGWQGPGIYGIEFDTYHNDFDPTFSRHIALIENTTQNHIAYSDFTFDPNVWYHVDITVDNGQFIVMMDNVEVLNYLYEGYNSEQPAYVGVSASTGGLSDSYVIDNLDLNVEHGPVNIDIQGTTTEIPPEGGQLIYDAFLTSEYPSPQEADAWTTITFPNGQVFGPMVRVHFNLIPGTTSFIGLHQDIPHNAPEGTFYFTAYLGRWPNPVVDTDRIVFHKSGVAATGINNWFASDWTPVANDEPSETVGLPSTYSVSRAYPNPFNPSTSVAVTLPEAGELNVSVFNVRGQKVAELANGSFSAGVHEFSFDGADLASGLYFIHAQVPGHLDEIQKVTLMK